ncbi:MAG: hypothetical protein MPK11_05345 [Gammaproteobacteria bacterium]|nr:hypothetical protein [Gammaproteobacteria bacterium]CAJ2376746.1 MAG: hypothetical protein IBGAMO2_440016 [Arenicellales bacterium IbO2]MDA7961769.1 hypothetical protein [Gammaproteobacteria bacterium]MDA7970183.1 hypothetical protein [Gammaproteobacteria bacterium]MDA7995403.1 hypothetical protein [Gammaproteobacteria bacterium]
MPTITEFCAHIKGKEIPADAQGNNVAFSCIHCKHPVLAIAVEKQRGSPTGKKSAKCIKCKEEYKWTHIDDKQKRIHIRALGKRRRTHPLLHRFVCTFTKEK